MARQYNRYRNYEEHGFVPGQRRIPDRWNHYDNVGRDIDGTRFVAFKTPLDPAFFLGRNMPEELQFGVHSLMKMAKQANKEIGMVVDLTNTDRYYKKSEWGEYGVRYVKMNCPGHEVNEREDLVENFISVVKEFVADKANDGKLVGVHCTHGLNRTGYLICRYLIDIENYTAADAISMFEYYRGHEMERPHYKESLYEAELRKKEALQQEEIQQESIPQDPSKSPEDSPVKESEEVPGESSA